MGDPQRRMGEKGSLGAIFRIVLVVVLVIVIERWSDRPTVQQRSAFRNSATSMLRWNPNRLCPLVGKGTEYEFEDEDEYDFGTIARMEKLFFARSEGHARRQAQGIIGVSPVSGFQPRATMESLGRTLGAEPFADFQPSFGGTGETPMILFVPSERHACRQVEREGGRFTAPARTQESITITMTRTI
jgi:hypothetical protein